VRKAFIAGAGALLLGPTAILMSITVLLNPAAQANCLGLSAESWSTITNAIVPETSRVAFPLPSGSWVRTSGFGMRVHPTTHVRKLHTGSDFGAPAGTRILAAADGRVAYAGPAGGYGHLILIEHTVGGRRVASGYGHMYASGIHVKKGQTVTAGQHIADVGSDGFSTGPHLHFEIRPGGADAAPIDPVPWLKEQGAISVDQPSVDSGSCALAGAADAYVGGAPGHLVPDPTTSGKITARTAHVLTQIRDKFPNSAWSCYRRDAGLKSEHRLGRACDGTFGNSIGHRATGHALSYGWQVTNWVKANAKTLGVEYVIWQGKIWSVRRAAEGWRPYNGGGVFAPRSITGGHFDHLHVTARAG